MEKPEEIFYRKHEFIRKCTRKHKEKENKCFQIRIKIIHVTPSVFLPFYPVRLAESSSASLKVLNKFII